VRWAAPSPIPSGPRYSLDFPGPLARNTASFKLRARLGPNAARVTRRHVQPSSQLGRRHRASGVFLGAHV
jgi:hypothetical protein